MAFGLRALFNSGEKGRYEAIKVLILSAIYFLVIVTYTLVKVLKNSVFVAVVGKEYIWAAKLAAMFILVPPVLIYAFLVDNVRRYQLLMIYSTFFGLISLVGAYFIGHPTIGIANTDSSPYRIFGWLFYFLYEGYAPFVLSVFWAFVNSVNNPTSAKKHYGVMIASSKLGGIVSAGIAWLFLQLTSSTGERVFSDVANHQILLVVGSLSVLVIPLLIHILMKKVPGRFLHGYEAVYQFEKEQKRKGSDKPGVFEGLKLFLRFPYLLGIFGMLFFYEIINTLLSYQSIVIAETGAAGASDVSLFLFWIDFMMHFSGLFISLIGTSYLMIKFGERICLLLVPILTGFVLLFFMLTYSPWSLAIAFALFRSINYAFAQPVRESLYIPTVKEMKFKSKSWIDAFGSKLSKGTGSVFVRIAIYIAANMPVMLMPFYMTLFGIVTLFWTINAWALGHRFERAVANNEAIGSSEESDLLADQPNG